jgi:hypothetical protein
LVISSAGCSVLPRASAKYWARVSVRERRQHLVVPRKIADCDDVQARIALNAPMFAPQRAPGFDQRGLSLGARAGAPVLLEREFQFPVCADAGKTQYVCGAHPTLRFERLSVSEHLMYDSNEMFSRLSLEFFKSQP